MTDDERKAIIRGWYLTHALREPTQKELDEALFTWNAPTGGAEMAAARVFDSPAVLEVRTARRKLLGLT